MDIVIFVNEFNQQLGLKPADLAEKQNKMRQDAFAFYRIMPALFYNDIYGRFAARAQLLDHAAPRIVIDGDMHLQNFGAYRGPADSAVWGINDFDLCDIGSPEWDLERLATSVVLAARVKGIAEIHQRELVEELAERYFHHLTDNVTGHGYLTEADAHGFIKETIIAATARKRKEFLKKFTYINANGEYRFLTNDRTRPLSPEMVKELRDALVQYEHELPANDRVARPLKLIDFAEKIGSGGSSFGMDRYCVLVANAQQEKPPILLEIKHELPSLVANQSSDPSCFDARVIVKHQRALLGFINPLIGAACIKNRAFLVREIEPQKINLEVTDLKDEHDYHHLARQTAFVLARAHRLSSGSEHIWHDWIGGHEKTATQRLIDFALRYADQTEADYLTCRAAF